MSTLARSLAEWEHLNVGFVCIVNETRINPQNMPLYQSEEAHNIAHSTIQCKRMCAVVSMAVISLKVSKHAHAEHAASMPASVNIFDFEPFNFRSLFDLSHTTESHILLHICTLQR